MNDREALVVQVTLAFPRNECDAARVKYMTFDVAIPEATWAEEGGQEALLRELAAMVRKAHSATTA